MFKPSKLRAYLLRAGEAGLCPEGILEGSGTSWSDIESLQPMDLDEMGRLFDFVARRTPRDFALKCGHISHVRDFGIVGFAMMSLPTLREAFDHWNRYCLVAGHPLVTSVSEDGDQWRMEFVPRRLMSAEAQRFCIEASLAALEPIIEELTEAPATTLRIDFSFPNPGLAGLYEVFRTSNIQFDRNATVYYGCRSDLDRPIPAHDSEVSEMFHRQCDEELAVLTHARSLSEQLQDILRASTGSIPSLDEMATALGRGRRSLQRELSEQGISYQQLVQDFRMMHAMVLLGENRVNIKSIAFMLGFKDVGSFRRAFHGWTGKSVGEWQASRAPADGGAAPRASVQPLQNVA